jgi:hypothetical protein
MWCLMKRTASTLAFALALTILIAQTMLVELSRANPMPELDFPTEPVLTPPTIVVHSPVKDQNGSPDDLWLNFTIVKPEEWIQLPGPNGGGDAYGNPLYDILGNVTKVYYAVDGGERQNISLYDTPSYFDNWPNRTLNFSTRLALEEGAHSIKLGFEADSYYLFINDNPAPGEHRYSIKSVVITGASDVINFSVVEPGTFPTVPVAAASSAAIVAVVAVAGLLIYYRKRRLKAGDA